ncbi:amino acid ABC transporter substrate-binding protein [Coprobacillus sp. TM10-10]|nr:amino acid ABC transporter substrate-binding protein [Coprobacillus sp. TM10-10]
MKLLALTLLATVTTGCASSKQENTWDKIKEKKEIVIGTEGTFAPFSYYDDNDNLVGYDVEVSEALAKELGVKVKFVEVKWDSLIAGLDSDKYDLVTNQVAITAERKKKYDFSIPHTYSYPAIITKKDNTEITKMRNIKGRKFLQTGSSNFSKIVEKYNGEIVATNDWNENVSLVEQGRVADENITMIIVTHEMSFAHQISDKVIFMDQGQIVESSTAKQIFDHPQMPRTQQFLARYRGDTDYII